MVVQGDPTTSASPAHDRQQVDFPWFHEQSGPMTSDSGRRLHDSERPLTRGRRLYDTQRTIGRIEPMPATRQNKTFAPPNALTDAGRSQKNALSEYRQPRTVKQFHSFITGAGITADIAAKEHPQMSNLDMLRQMLVDYLLGVMSRWLHIKSNEGA